MTSAARGMHVVVLGDLVVDVVLAPATELQAGYSCVRADRVPRPPAGWRARVRKWPSSRPWDGTPPAER